MIKCVIMSCCHFLAFIHYNDYNAKKYFPTEGQGHTHKRQQWQSHVVRVTNRGARTMMIRVVHGFGQTCGYGSSVGFADPHQHCTCHGLPAGFSHPFPCSHAWVVVSACAALAHFNGKLI